MAEVEHKPSSRGPATDVREAVKSDKRSVLLVVGENIQQTHSLPKSGTLTIGRSDENDIVIDDQSISRKHATIILDQSVRVIDHESVNGTWIGDERISPNVEAIVHANQPIHLGSIMLVFQTWSPASRPRRLRTHEYFEARLDEECVRASRRGDSFGVLFVSVVHGATDPHSLFSLCLRETDLVAQYAPGQFEILVIDTNVQGEAAVVNRIQSAAERHNLAIRLGDAWFPRDGRDAPSLVARARERCGEPAASTLDTSLVVNEPAMRALHGLIERVAVADISVLLLGETGVGKEMIAAEIHRKSSRSDKPYVPLNCSALTDTLMESELFGHEKGAFTGATTSKAGLLESANGGVLFLDEIGELPLSTQVKLLRVLDERRVTRVGGLQSKPIDVRIVSATNRDVDAEVARGTFRSDLLYRLNAMTIQVPPLRERRSEIEPLARFFVQKFSDKMGKIPPILSDDALRLCNEYSWPGNVRELRNVMERAVVLSAGGVISRNDLPLEKMLARFADQALGPRATQPRVTMRPSTDSGSIPVARAASPSLPPDEFSGRSWRGRAWNREEIEAALAACGGNQAEAAKRLGVSRRTLINRIEQLGVARPRKREQPE